MIWVDDQSEFSNVLHVSNVHAFLVRLRRKLARERVSIKKQLNDRFFVVEAPEFTGNYFPDNKTNTASF